MANKGLLFLSELQCQGRARAHCFSSCALVEVKCSGTFLAHLRNILTLRHVFGAPAQHPNAQQRTWRPPVSGHGTPRFAALEAHPFSNTALGNIESERAPQDAFDYQSSAVQTHQIDPINTRLFPPPKSQEQSQTTQRSYRRVLSPSQRTLQAINHNAVPVSPRRARNSAEASNASRTVLLPRTQQRESPSAIRGSGPQSAQNDTVRTVDLIEQFPAPPNPIASDHTANGRGRWPFLSSFPASNDNQSRDGSARHGTSASSKKLQCEPQSNTVLGGSNHGIISREGSTGSNDHHNMYHLDRFPNYQTREGHDICISNTENEPEADHPSIRGEGSARYRHSGPPVYDNDAASLRSFDQNTDAWQLDYPSPNRPMSALTGDSRYFSAASTALGTRAMSQTQAPEREQEKRAAADRATRFTRGDEHADPANRSTSNNENNFPITPVTITQASGEYCPHRQNRLQSERYDLDGTSPPSVSFSAPSSPPTRPCEPYNDVGAASIPAPDQIDWSHRHRMIQQHRGTWGTRMKRTKCWRCELESRRTASREALRNQFTAWRGWMMRVHEKLRWTCLCRYQAYGDNSDEDLGRQGQMRERVRLGRMGGNLSSL